MGNGTIIYFSDYDIINILYRFNFYSMVILIPIGIVGNIISIFIFTRPSFNQKTNTGRLYSFLCVVNLITIVFVTAFKNKNDFTQYSIQLPLSTEKFIEHTMYQSLSWIQVIISVDRFIFVLYPIKGVRFMSKKWVLYSIILGSFIFILGLNSPYFIRHSHTYTNYLNQSITIFDYMSPEIAILSFNVQVLMRFFIPYFLMLIVDAIVIIRLKRSKIVMRNRHASIWTRQTSHTAKKSSRFTRNTILIDLIYLIFNFPSIIDGIYRLVFSYFPKLISLSLLLREILNVLFPLFSFYYLSLIFILFLVFNRIFRSEFILLFRLQKIFNIVTTTNH